MCIYVRGCKKKLHTHTHMDNLENFFGPADDAKGRWTSAQLTERGYPYLLAVEKQADAVVFRLSDVLTPVDAACFNAVQNAMPAGDCLQRVGPAYRLRLDPPPFGECGYAESVLACCALFCNLTHSFYPVSWQQVIQHRKTLEVQLNKKSAVARRSALDAILQQLKEATAPVTHASRTRFAAPLNAGAVTVEEKKNVKPWDQI